jgi:hypothetical protein
VNFGSYQVCGSRGGVVKMKPSWLRPTWVARWERNGPLYLMEDRASTSITSEALHDGVEVARRKGSGF